MHIYICVMSGTFMRKYMYIYIYVYIHTYIHVSLYPHEHVHEYSYIFIYIHATRQTNEHSVMTRVTYNNVSFRTERQASWYFECRHSCTEVVMHESAVLVKHAEDVLVWETDQKLASG